MPATLTESLITLAQQFRAVPQGTGPGPTEFAFRIVAPPGGEEGLTVTDLITRTELVDGDLDLTWRTKDVRFLNRDITNADTTGGMPIPDLLTLNIGSAMDGGASPPGVPGVLGTLAGTIPIPIETTTEETLAVRVDVRWRITDEAGTVVGEVAWRLGAGGAGLEGTGGEIVAAEPNGLAILNLVFSAIFVELTSTPQPTVRRRIQASVRLSAGGVSSGWVDLPPLEITLPAVPVPTVLALFEHSNFDGLALVVVPASSPLSDEGAARTALGALRDTLNTLGDLAGAASFFIAEVDAVTAAIDRAKVTFRKADEIPNLNDIDLDSGFFNDTEAEDELSSLLFVGPPRRQVQCFNARNFNDEEGQMNVTVGPELLVKVGSLHSATPASEPAGLVSVPVTPAGTRFDFPDPFADIDDFGDEFSSLRFA